MSRSATRSRRAVVSSTLIVFGLSGALVLAAGIAFGGGRSSGSVTPSTGHPGSTGADASSQKSADVLAKAITVAQQRLWANPKDWSTWAQLGVAYVQEGRITVDPSYYPKAEGALNKSLALNSDDNYQALIGLGALANARHDFSAALAYGQQGSRD